MMRLLALGIIALLTNPVWSFTCIYTLAKDSCWTDYTVSVNVIDAVTAKRLFTATVPAGKQWAQVKFACDAEQKLTYRATFSPIIWEGQKNNVYSGLRNWVLPSAVDPKSVAWTIPVCFSKDFSEVPLPPTARGNCACDFESIPEPKIN